MEEGGPPLDPSGDGTRTITKGRPRLAAPRTGPTFGCGHPPIDRRMSTAHLAPLTVAFFLLGCPTDFPADGFFDFDGDGFGTSDCDDSDINVFPGGTEVCGGDDEDCDGLVDDEDDAVQEQHTFFRDKDGDGFGDGDNREEGCAPTDGFAAEEGDCDDEDADINPAAAEVCDDGRVDEDCSGASDDDDDATIEKSTWYGDKDEDGFGDAGDPLDWCHPPEEYVAAGTDCDDDNDDVHPDATEVCNDIDDDCDGEADDADSDGGRDATRWYTDEDGDGYGAGSAREACEKREGEVDDSGDCDDDAGSINPGAEEVCNDDIDQDCDGSGETCFLQGKVASRKADAIVVGAESGGVWGWTIASGGDTDGDGRAEVWVAGPQATGMGSGTGGAVMVTGRLSGSGTADAFGLVEALTHDIEEWGYSIASGADLDGDGRDDVVIGSPLADPAGNDEGFLTILTGPVATGSSELDALATVQGNESDDYLGSSIALGDFNGDGTGDLFMTQPNDDNVIGLLGPFKAGESWTTSSYDVAADGESYERLSIGDATGDGLDDLIVGDYGYSRAWLYEGGTTGSLDTYDAAATFDSSYSTISLGWASLVGDYDRDGYGDLVLGCPATDDERGMVYLIEGPLSGDYDDTDVDLELRGETVLGYVGYTLAFSADANDNGDAELLVGAPGEADGNGVVYVIDGSPSSGAHTTSDVETYVEGSEIGGELGLSLGAADIDGDGWTDYVLGGDDVDTSGGAAVFYGAGR